MKSSTKEINILLDTIIKSVIRAAEKNIYTLMPGFTHLKNAQPVSFGHYLMAYVEMCKSCLLYTSPSPRDKRQSRMPSSA